MPCVPRTRRFVLFSRIFLLYEQVVTVPSKHSHDRAPGTAVSLSVRRCLFICAVLGAAVIAIYLQTRAFDFIAYDDLEYVSRNPVVGQGITPDGIRWALTTFHKANWHPVTWMSHMLDVELFGMNPGMHHLVNASFHLMNTLLLFFVLALMTGSAWKSAAVAALFAVHPLHAESVAWISERKDVLSAFFWLLSMAAYVWYTRRRSLSRYLPVMVFLALGLMSKPMLVTLPFVFLLTDVWPLQRWSPWEPETRNDPAQVAPALMGNRQGLSFLVMEKVPLFVLSAVSCIVTLLAQHSGGAVKSLEHVSFSSRAANAVVSYVSYLGKAVFPHDLAVLYPYPSAISLVVVALSASLLILVSALALASAKKAPYLAFGWFWYIGTLVPVIGIVQVGAQAMADRYTYIPLVGVFIAAVWGLEAALCRHRYRRQLLVVSAFVIPVFMWVSHVQAGYWRDSTTLFRRSIEVTQDNFVMHYNLGTVLIEQRDFEGARRAFEAALRIHPGFIEAHNNLGALLLLNGDLGGAFHHLTRSLQMDPHQPGVHSNMGTAFLLAGDHDRAIEYFEKACRGDPSDAQACANLQKAKDARRD